MKAGFLRMTRKTHHAHRHLHHLVSARVRVVHEGPRLHQIELVDVGLAGGYEAATDPDHQSCRRRSKTVPVHVVLGSFVVT